MKNANLQANQPMHRVITSTMPHFKAIGQVGLSRFPCARSVDDAACYGSILNCHKGTVSQMHWWKHITNTAADTITFTDEEETNQLPTKFPGSINDNIHHGSILSQLEGTAFQIPQQRHNTT